MGAEDTTGEETKTLKIIRLINSNHSSSLLLHPVILRGRVM
jgi:hypothetical protein